MPQIHIDLRRDLPKVREQLEAILPNMGKCRYAAPCVIGVMLPKSRRPGMDRVKNGHGFRQVTVDTLVDRGFVSIPTEQKGDAYDLQNAFDAGFKVSFLKTLARLEAKYLTGEVA